MCVPAPVSEPVVSQVCVSPEEMRVSCSSAGDRLEFIWSLDNHLFLRTQTNCLSNWTLDGQSLATNTTVQAKPSILTISISLHGQLTTSLNCSVQNNVSRREAVIHLTRCEGGSKTSMSFAFASFATAPDCCRFMPLFKGIVHPKM